ncbi:MAG TPA: GYDIA family GHMP kinase [Lentimicrobium sp.]|nr:GYDIA family GHMP kinase [Lentimicrobium sp.]
MNHSEGLSANGKLLLTGEYLILDGAAGLALPLIFKQALQIKPSNDNLINWIATDINGTWFTGKFSTQLFDVVETSDTIVAYRLQKFLQAASSLNPLQSRFRNGAVINTTLNFDRFMGLGSSSTLISLIADLFGTDKYRLHSLVSIGSGYDVACSGYNHPIMFKKISEDYAVIKPVNFLPPFAENLYFIWQGKKQDSNEEIQFYRNLEKRSIQSFVEKITDITLKIIKVKELSNFVSLIELHEEAIASLLRRKALKSDRFSDFNGCIKSLGAWGGDFILAACDNDLNYVLDYFGKKGCKTVYRFEDIVLNEKVIHDDDINIRF